MNFLIDIAKKLLNMNPVFLFSIAAFVVFLVLLVLKGSILQTGIRIFTKKRYDFSFMIMPTLLSILTNMILLFISYVILTNNNIDILELTIQYLFDSVTDFKQILYIIIAVVASELVFLIIQTFILKLVDFDVYKSIKKLFVKNADSNNIESTEEIIGTVSNDTFLDDENKMAEDTPSKLSFVNGLLSGVFCFSIMFFLTIILLYIGTLIGTKFIA